MSDSMKVDGAQVGPFTGLIRPVLVSAGLYCLIAGLAYPLATTGVAAVLFPHQAGGSLIVQDGQVIGSALIGQVFTKPEDFHPRPSVTTGPDPKNPNDSILQPYNAANSGASNLGPDSKTLIQAVKNRVIAYRQENGLTDDTPVPVDAVTSSGSGLDPDISIANARLQAKRVAHARHIPVQQVLGLIGHEAHGPQYGVLGNLDINVLELNLALDKMAPLPAAN
jgi:potassium-transporting ATPase KdpC subunit